MTLAHTKTYQDYPECLPRYRWLVEEALKQPDRMFNMAVRFGLGSFHACKCCGVPVEREDWKGHVLGHAVQLKIVQPVEVAAELAPEVESPLLPDVVATVKDTLDVRLEGILLKVDAGYLTAKLATVIVTQATEGSTGEMALCDDCRLD
jgi:hypothetical protein